MKMFHKHRHVVIVLVLVMLLGSLFQAAAGGSQEAEAVSGKETVVWQNFLSAEKAFAPVIDEMIGLFESKNEGVEIEIVELPYEQTLQQTIISASADSMADVVLLVPQWVPPLVELNSLEPLDSYFSSSDLADIPNAAYDSGVVKGKTYSVPALLNVVLVWAWKPLLEQGRTPSCRTADLGRIQNRIEKSSCLGRRCLRICCTNKQHRQFRLLDVSRYLGTWRTV
jgi:ABC-type glycerol-3-phosphate transport system substrate-binding protein